MIIQIDKLKTQPRQVEVDELASAFPVLHDLTEQEQVAFTGPIKGVLTATWAGDVIEVSGQLATLVETPCARCLVPVSTGLRVSPVLCYSSKPENVVDSEEMEIGRDELGLIHYEGLEIDLRPDLEQEIIMALPQQLLCSSECLGLCPVCGINLNQKQCECEKPVFHSGLEALKGFKVKQ